MQSLSHFASYQARVLSVPGCLQASTGRDVLLVEGSCAESRINTAFLNFCEECKQMPRKWKILFNTDIATLIFFFFFFWVEMWENIIRCCRGFLESLCFTRTGFVQCLCRWCVVCVNHQSGANGDGAACSLWTRHLACWSSQTRLYKLGDCRLVSTLSFHTSGEGRIPLLQHPQTCSSVLP